MNKLTTLQELQDNVCEYHKDLMGFRLRVEDALWNDEAWLRQKMASLDAAFASRSSTFEGREELREEGWMLEDETDPHLKMLSDANKEARNARYKALMN